MALPQPFVPSLQVSGAQRWSRSSSCPSFETVQCHGEFRGGPRVSPNAGVDLREDTVIQHRVKDLEDRFRGLLPRLQQHFDDERSEASRRAKAAQQEALERQRLERRFTESHRRVECLEAATEAAETDLQRRQRELEDDHRALKAEVWATATREEEGQRRQLQTVQRLCALEARACTASHDRPSPRALSDFSSLPSPKVREYGESSHELWQVEAILLQEIRNIHERCERLEEASNRASASVSLLEATVHDCRDSASRCSTQLSGLDSRCHVLEATSCSEREPAMIHRDAGSGGSASSRNAVSQRARSPTRGATPAIESDSLAGSAVGLHRLRDCVARLQQNYATTGPLVKAINVPTNGSFIHGNTSGHTLGLLDDRLATHRQVMLALADLLCVSMRPRATADHHLLSPCAIEGSRVDDSSFDMGMSVDAGPAVEVGSRQQSDIDLRVVHCEQGLADLRQQVLTRSLDLGRCARLGFRDMRTLLDAVLAKVAHCQEPQQYLLSRVERLEAGLTDCSNTGVALSEQAALSDQVALSERCLLSRVERLEAGLTDCSNTGVALSEQVADVKTELRLVRMETCVPAFDEMLPDTELRSICEGELGAAANAEGEVGETQLVESVLSAAMAIIARQQSELSGLTDRLNLHCIDAAIANAPDGRDGFVLPDLAQILG